VATVFKLRGATTTSGDCTLNNRLDSLAKRLKVGARLCGARGPVFAAEELVELGMDRGRVGLVIDAVELRP
jgi:hypothetical protein